MEDDKFFCGKTSTIKSKKHCLKKIGETCLDKDHCPSESTDDKSNNSDGQ